VAVKVGATVAGALHGGGDRARRKPPNEVRQRQIERRRDGAAVAVGCKIRNVAVAADIKVGAFGEIGRTQPVEPRLRIERGVAVDDLAGLPMA
jgi:hypothetical protein